MFSVIVLLVISVKQNMAADKILNFRCPTDLLAVIEARAISLNRTKTEIVISALRSALNLPQETPATNIHRDPSWITPNPLLAALEERLSIVEKQLKIEPAKLPGEYGKPEYSLGVAGHLSLNEAYIYAVWHFGYKGSMVAFSLLSIEELLDFGLEYYHKNAQPGTEFRPYKYAPSFYY